MSIELNDNQIDSLSAITEGGSTNFWQGYLYIRSIIEIDPYDENFAYWLTKASEINSNDANSEARDFIRGVTRNGFLFSEVSAFDIQANSDLIGKKVVTDILDGVGIPSLEDIVKNDVAAAITTGNQTIGGWGGAFYYWNFPLPPELGGGTVGSQILGDKLEYDKFIACTAKAVADTMVRFGITFEQFRSAMHAQVPLGVQAEILARITAVALNEVPSFAGDPQDIDGYHPIYGPDEVVTGWWYNTVEELRVDVTDPSLIAELNARHEARLRLATDPAFQAPNPDAGLHVGGGLEAMADDSNQLNLILAQASASFAALSGAQAPLAQLAAWYAERFAFTEGAGAEGGGHSSGILGSNLAGSVLTVDFSDEVASIIEYAGANSRGQATALTEAEALKPKEFALKAVYNALAANGAPTAAETAQLSGAIRGAWQVGETAPATAAAGKLEHFAFESNNSGGVTLQAAMHGDAAVSSALVGGSGADTLTGLDADDILIGRGGADVLSGGKGADILFGGDGNDVLDGGEGNDFLLGGDGNDTFLASEGVDIALGGAGADIFVSGMYDAGFFVGGAGNDIFEVDASLMPINPPVSMEDLYERFQPPVIWGGAGSDEIRIKNVGGGYSATIVVVIDENITEQNFYNINNGNYKSWAQNHIGSIVVVNPDPGDFITLNGVRISGATYDVIHERPQSYHVNQYGFEDIYGYGYEVIQNITSPVSNILLVGPMEVGAGNQRDIAQSHLGIFYFENGDFGIDLVGNGPIFDDDVHQYGDLLPPSMFDGPGRLSFPTSDFLLDSSR